MAYDTKKTSRKAGGDFGRALRSIRLRQNCGQAEFARLQGWPQATLSQYESGDARPSTERLIALLRLAADDERDPILTALKSRGILASDLDHTLVTSAKHIGVSGVDKPPISGVANDIGRVGDNLDGQPAPRRTPVKSRRRSARGTRGGVPATTSGCNASGRLDGLAGV